MDLVIGLLISLYFLPTVFALIGRNRNSAAIFALNLLAGWTLIGWVIAVVWSLKNDPAPPAQRQFLTPPRSLYIQRVIGSVLLALVVLVILFVDLPK